MTGAQTHRWALRGRSLGVLVFIVLSRTGHTTAGVSFDLVGNGMCRDKDGRVPRYFYRSSMARSSCQAFCDGIPSCVAYSHKSQCYLYGNGLASYYSGGELSGYTAGGRVGNNDPWGTDAITTAYQGDLLGWVCYRKTTPPTQPELGDPCGWNERYNHLGKCDDPSKTQCWASFW